MADQNDRTYATCRCMACEFSNGNQRTQIIRSILRHIGRRMNAALKVRMRAAPLDMGADRPTLFSVARWGLVTCLYLLGISNVRFSRKRVN